MSTTYNALSNGAPDAVSSEMNLIRFSQNGDRDAFASLYETHLDRIHRYIYYRVYDQDTAEDITSLVFLKVWEKLDTFQGGQIPFAKWLYRIAHNTVIDYYRTRKPVIALDDVDPLKLSHSDGSDESIDIQILSNTLLEAMDELTDTQREVLILRFVFGLTTTEIACKLRKKQGAVRALQMRGLRKLSEDTQIRTQLAYA